MIHRADPRSGERPDGRAHASRVMQPGGHAGAITAEDVVHLGTAGGAQILGLPGVGSLAPGQAADIAIYDLDHPRYFGLHDPAAGPVVSGGQPSIRALLVQGRIVVENNTIPGLDLAAMRRQAQAFVLRTQSP
jgi:cytosine/adenosine deaminase-related metal-dependent hydrolase